MLSKSLLEWPTQGSAQPNSEGELTSVLPEKRGNPLAWAPNGSDIEARWRAIGMTYWASASPASSRKDGIAPMEPGDVAQKLPAMRCAEENAQTVP
jgi:hypothetical protein